MKQSTHAILKKHFDKRRSEGRGVSLRSIAERLEISHSFLSRVFAGKKPVSYALLVKLGRALDIDSETMSSLKSSPADYVGDAKVVRRGRADNESAVNAWELADKESFSALRQWFYLAVLEFTTLEEFDGSAAMIASRLGVALPSVEIAMRELARLGLLEEVEGVLRKTKKQLRWSSSAKHMADVRRFHGQMLKKAEEALVSQTSEDDFARRLITGITVTASPAKIEAAKRRLADCLHEIAADLASDDGTDVYHLSTQLFPLTKRIG
jgi:uncharacterized protein (TIGR02147 family)